MKVHTAVGTPKLQHGTEEFTFESREKIREKLWSTARRENLQCCN
jgi:hypothetical protein